MWTYQTAMVTLTGSKRLPRRLFGVLVALVAFQVCVLLLLYKVPRHPVVALPLAEVQYSVIQDDAADGDRRFVIIVPADNPNPDLCKLVMSATALGYPAPILVNWGTDFSKNDGGKWAPFLGKITGTLEYLDQITHKNTNKGDRLSDNDVVLIVDAYDIWFQLPPAALLQRYHKSNKLANSRLLKQWGASDSENMPMQQTILISSQRRCYPEINSGSDLHCNELPLSPLEPNLYGSKTDAGMKNYHDNRPRFINSGSFMGPIGDMKRYFRQAKNKMDKQIAEGTPFDGDQGIFGEILGEQEIWRQWRRSQNATSTSVMAPALIQRDLEFHVGLDYSQELFLPTIYGEKDGNFVSLDNASDIKRHSETLNISPVRLNGVPKDLAEIPNPLRQLQTSKGDPGWGTMPLYADFFTTAVPALLHHNAWKDGLKQRRVEWWDQTWFFPHLRDLVTLHLKPAKLLPLANIPTGSGHQRYFAPESYASMRKPRIFEAQSLKAKMNEVDFNVICRYPDENEASENHWYDEVFRDGKDMLS